MEDQFDIGSPAWNMMDEIEAQLETMVHGPDRYDEVKLLTWFAECVVNLKARGLDG